MRRAKFRVLLARITRNVGDCTATIAYEHFGVWFPFLPIDEGFTPVFVAVCTYLMRKFGRLHAVLQSVAERPVPFVVKFVAILLTFPVFEVSHFFFKLAYSCNQRRLRLMCGEDMFLKLYDCGVPHGRGIHILNGLRNIRDRLERADPVEYFRNHPLPPQSRKTGEAYFFFRRM